MTVQQEYAQSSAALRTAFTEVTGELNARQAEVAEQIKQDEESLAALTKRLGESTVDEPPAPRTTTSPPAPRPTRKNPTRNAPPRRLHPRLPSPACPTTRRKSPRSTGTTTHPRPPPRHHPRNPNAPGHPATRTRTSPTTTGSNKAAHP